MTAAEQLVNNLDYDLPPNYASEREPRYFKTYDYYRDYYNLGRADIQILGAAHYFCYQKGSSSVTNEDIAKKAGLSKRTFYYSKKRLKEKGLFSSTGQVITLNRDGTYNFSATTKSVKKQYSSKSKIAEKTKPKKNIPKKSVHNNSTNNFDINLCNDNFAPSYFQERDDYDSFCREFGIEHGNTEVIQLAEEQIESVQNCTLCAKIAHLEDPSYNIKNFSNKKNMCDTFFDINITNDIDIDKDMELELAVANELATKNSHTYFDYNFSNDQYDTPTLLDNKSNQIRSEKIDFDDGKVVHNAIVLDSGEDELKTNLYTISDNVLNANEKSETKDNVCKDEYEVVASNEIIPKSISSPVTSLTIIPRNIIQKRDNNRVFKGESKAVIQPQSRKLHLTYSLEKEIKNIGIQLSLTACKTYKVRFIDNFMCKSIITNVFSDINDLDAIRNAIDDIQKYRTLTSTSNKEIMTNDLINWIKNKDNILQKREEEDKIQKELAENRIKETEMFLKINETNKEIEAIKKSEANIRVENFVKSLPIEFQEKYMKYSKNNRRTFKRELEELGEENFSRMINSEIDTEKHKQGRIDLFKNNIKSVSY